MGKPGILKLPLEAIQQIISITVKKCSVDQAIMLRLTPEMFDREIIRALCLTDAIELGWRVRLLHPRLLSDRLIARTIADRDCEHYISMVIRDTINYILEQNPQDESRREEYTQALCIATVQSHGRWQPNSDIYDVLVPEARAIRSRMGDRLWGLPSRPECNTTENALAASAYLGMRHLCWKLIQDGVKDALTYFGRPSQLIAGKGDLKAARLIFENNTTSVWRIRDSVAEAAANGHINVVELLLNWDRFSNGSDFPQSARGSVYHWSISRAAEAGQSDMIQFLIQHATLHGVLDTKTHTFRGYYEGLGTVKFSLHGIILRSAALEGQEEVASTALLHGASPNTTDCGLEPKRTPLEVAAEKGHEKIVRILLRHSASTKGQLGFGPLVRAVRQGWLRIVQLLIDNGAVVNLRANMADDLPLMAAVIGGQAECLSLLLENGAEFNNYVTSRDAYIYAALGQYSTIVQILEEHGIKHDVSQFKTRRR